MDEPTAEEFSGDSQEENFTMPGEGPVREARAYLRKLAGVLIHGVRRVPASEVRQQLSDTIEWVTETNRTVIVTNHGKPEAVVLSFEAYRKVAMGLAYVGLRLESSGKPWSDEEEDRFEQEGAALAKQFKLERR